MVQNLKSCFLDAPPLTIRRPFDLLPIVMKFPACLAVVLILSVRGLSAERINQEGRVLGPLPVVTHPILFNTTNADAILSAMQIFPLSNPWNEDISHRPVLANSEAMIARILSDLTPNHRTLVAEYEMNFVLVPDSQPRVRIHFFNYPGESDLDGGTTPYGWYPIPANLPVETWPAQTGSQTLSQWQTSADDSDRHAIMVAPGSGFIWETWDLGCGRCTWRWIKPWPPPTAGAIWTWATASTPPSKASAIPSASPPAAPSSTASSP